MESFIKFFDGKKKETMEIKTPSNNSWEEMILFLKFQY
jgi:hypothetical protein